MVRSHENREGNWKENRINVGNELRFLTENDLKGFL